MTKRERERLSCAYCDGLGQIETDNNGPIVECPVCKPWAPDEPADPKHHALRSEEME
jgi:hypothetical protein